MPNDAERALILIADVPEGAEILKKCLSPHHDLVLVHSLGAATRLIANVDFDAIVGGTHFDDSRLIDLLRLVRAESRFNGKPFVAVRLLPTTMTAELEANARQMATVLGADVYITIDDYVSEADLEKELRAKLGALLRSQSIDRV